MTEQEYLAALARMTPTERAKMQRGVQAVIDSWERMSPEERAEVNRKAAISEKDERNARRRAARKKAKGTPRNLVSGCQIE